MIGCLLEGGFSVEMAGHAVSLLDAYIYGGHSGGPSWRYDSGTGNRYVEGVHSTSTRIGSATDTLLTQLPSRCIAAVMVSVYTVAVRTNRRTAVIVASVVSRTRETSLP